MKFKGIGVALVTPFKKDLSIDFESLRRLVDYVIEGGVDYLVALGTTGETAALTDEEQRKVLDVIINQNAGRLPIVAGNFGGYNTAGICQKLKTYDFTGIDAILSASPAYVKPSQEGIFQHYVALEKVSPLPIILYNVPSRTSSNISVDTVVKLSHHSDKFIGIKDASGDIVQGTNIIEKSRADFFVTSGDDPTALGLQALGGVGVISVIANVYPKFSNVFKAFDESQNQKAKALNNQYLDIHPLLYVEGNPAGIKAALEIKGLMSRKVRLPLAEMSNENYEKLKLVLI